MANKGSHTLGLPLPNQKPILQLVIFRINYSIFKLIKKIQESDVLPGKTEIKQGIFQIYIPGKGLF